MLLKPSTLILFCLFVYSYSSNAQQTKKPQLEVNGSINFALNEGYPLWGLGSHAKLLFPVGKKDNALVATLGFDRLYEDFDYGAYSYTFALTSIGYRKNIKSFFIEPKAGFGIDIEDGYDSFCGFIGIEPGIQKRKFIFSIDYRFISSDGLVEGDHFHTFAIRMGYKITGK
ncbi:MAG: hypothetical protein QM768_01920 [Agriterribacter sp.]